MMKKISILTLIITSYLAACPTCVGKITHKSPPFFSDNFYAPEQKKIINQIDTHKEKTTVENEENAEEDLE